MNPRPIIPVGLVLLVLNGCGLAMKEKPIVNATGWSYYPYPSICWQAGSPVWRIEPAASGLDRDVYGCLREVAGVADRSLPGLCVFISPQQRAQIDPAAGTPLAGIVKGKADTPATPAPHPGSQDDGARVDAGAAAGECKEGREGADPGVGIRASGPERVNADARR